MSGLSYIKRAILVEVFLLFTLFSFLDMEKQQEDYSANNNIAAEKIKVAVVIKEITANNTALRRPLIQAVQTSNLYKKFRLVDAAFPRLTEICAGKNKLRPVLVRITQFDEI